MPSDPEQPPQPRARRYDTYVINMDSRPDRMQRVLAMLQSHGWTESEVQRIPAVVGKALSAEELERLVSQRARGELIAGREVHEGMPSLGAVGCTLSHVEAWRRVAAAPRPALVLEDDARFALDERELARLIDSAVAQQAVWDVCFLNPAPFLDVEPLSDDLNRLAQPWPRGKAFCGTHAYLVTPAGAAQLLQGALPIEIQTDFYMQSCAALRGLRLAMTKRLAARQLTLAVQLRNLLTGRSDTNVQAACVKCHIPNWSRGQTMAALLVLMALTLALAAGGARLAGFRLLCSRLPRRAAAGAAAGAAAAPALNAV